MKEGKQSKVYPRPEGWVARGWRAVCLSERVTKTHTTSVMADKSWHKGLRSLQVYLFSSLKINQKNQSFHLILNGLINQHSFCAVSQFIEEDLEPKEIASC